LSRILGQLHVSQARIAIPDRHILEAPDDRLVRACFALPDLLYQRCEFCLHCAAPLLLAHVRYSKPHMLSKTFHVADRRCWMSEGEPEQRRYARDACKCPAYSTSRNG
jgi:hypothetical protein